MPKVLFDFTDPKLAEALDPIDDRVMGGVSSRRLRHDPAGHGVLEDEVSPERNGVFASARSRPGVRGKPGANACLIDVRGAASSTSSVSSPTTVSTA